MTSVIPDLAELQSDPAHRARMEDITARPVTLSVEAIGKRFATTHGEVEALRDVSFAVHRREFICVIGPSGCGKSTLIRSLAGLEQPSNGQILLDGAPVSQPGPERGMIFQGYSLFPWLTVKRNVMFGLLTQGAARTRAESEARQWIEQVGLGGFENHYPHQLSGGMQQRVAIARALAVQPRILLMDEPFGALDAQTRAMMQAHLLEIWRNVNVTALFITHDLDEAVYLADRILVLAAHPGRVQEVVEVPVPRPRHPDQFLSPAFLACKQHIQQLIHRPVAEPDPLGISRLTPVGDDAE